MRVHVTTSVELSPDEMRRVFVVVLEMYMGGHYREAGEWRRSDACHAGWVRAEPTEVQKAAWNLYAAVQDANAARRSAK
jgi:hypothetical protein